MEVASITPRGFNEDLPPDETGAGVYNKATNVVFNDGIASSPPGWSTLSVTLTGDPLWILPVFTPLVYYWIYGGNNAAGTAGFLAVTDGSTNYDITPAGGLSVTAQSDWTGGVLNGVPVINNSLDDPVYWDLDTSNAAQTLPDWPANTKCKALRPFKFHLMAMNITQSSVEYPDWILHSDAADPGDVPQSWTAGPTTQAGSFTVSTGDGGIVDGAELRDLFVVYKQRGNAIVQYTGSSFIFSTRRVFIATGMLSTDCAQEYHGQHYVITDGDIVRHNGQQVESLVDGSLRNWIFSQLSSDVSPAHVTISHSDKQVWFNFPTNGATYCNKSLVWDLNTESMGTVDFDTEFSHMARGILGDLSANRQWNSQSGSWDAFQGRWNAVQGNAANDTLMFSYFDDQELNYFDGALRDGAESTCTLQLLSKDLVKPTAYKTIDRIYVNGDGGTYVLDEVVTGRIGTQEHPSDPIRWSPELSLYRNKSLSYGVSGRYISLELTMRQRDVWKVSSIDIHYVVTGR